MSLTLGTMACSGMLAQEETRPGKPPGSGRMHSLPSMDDWALRLHSCRALSSQPHVSITNKIE